jgi:hypothetical protein
MLKTIITTKKIFIIISLLTLIGCAATHTAINKRELDVQTKMSKTIFLDPVDEHEKTVFVQVKNTSDKQELNLTQEINTAIAAKGYRIVTNARNAHYLFQVNVLQAGKADLRETEKALDHGFDGAFTGAITGAAIGAMSSKHSDAAIGMGLLGGIVGTVVDATVKDVAYSIITDVQISERTTAPEKIKVTETKRTITLADSSGEATKHKTKTTEERNWKRYETRIISTANKVNLKFEDALPDLIKGLKNSISGIMG